MIRDFSAVDVYFLKISCILVVLYWQLCASITAGYYFDYGRIGEQQLSNIWPEVKVPDAYSGVLYHAKIASSNLSDYDIRLLVSKVGSEELPLWLQYSDKDYSLTGIPLETDVARHQFFVLAMRYNETTSNSDLVGAQTFEIDVKFRERLSYCDEHRSVVVTEVSLAVNGTHLNATQRIKLYEYFVTEFDLSTRTSSVYFEDKLARENSSFTGCDVSEKYETNSSYVGPVLSISWLVGCGLNQTLLTNTTDRISKKLAGEIFEYPVFSWRILSGNDSDVCFLEIRKSTGVSSAHPSTLGKTTSTSARTLLVSSSTLTDVSESAAIAFTVLTDSISSRVPTTAPQLLPSSINQSSLMHGRLSSLFTPSPATQQVNSSALASLQPSFHPTTLTVPPSPTFTSAMWAPTISQSITPTRNSDPVVQRTLPTLNISSCQYLYFEVPEDTFWDHEDGNTTALTLRLLTKSLRELPIDSWVNLDVNRDVIYGVPVSSQIFTNSTHAHFEYMLSAVDSSGRAVNTSLVLTVYDDLAPTGQRVSLEVDAYSKPVSLSSLWLLQEISGYLYHGHNATMEVLNVTTSPAGQVSTRISLSWSDCQAIRDVCDIARVERTSKLIRIDENFLNPHFVIALVPDFVVVDARSEKLGMCLNEPPLATRSDVRINITCCGKFRYQIPRDLFHDEEDGDIRNLSLTIRYPTASRSLSETWVVLNDTAKTIEGVVVFEEARKYPDSHFQEFFIVAKDSGRLETNVSVVITVQHPLPVSKYFVSLFLKRLHSFPTSVEEMFIIIEKLGSYFDGASSDEIRVLSYSRESTVTVFTWSMAWLQFKPCDPVAIANISEKLKDSNGQVNDDFKLLMKPEFEVQFIFEERLGHCKEGANEQPSVLISVHNIRLNPNSTYFEYEIPAITFSDLEDGNTRNLKLSLFLPSFQSLPHCSWIVLDSGKQAIYGVPDEEAVQAQPVGGYRYLLVGQDSGGKVASSSVLVQIPRTSEPYNYQITAILRSYLEASLPCIAHVVEFLGKLGTFLGEGQENIRVVSYNISKTYPADVTISWTNRTASFNTCDHEMIRKGFEEFTNDDTGVAKPFSEILLPYFFVHDIELEFRETCSVFPNTPPVLLQPVETLRIPQYQALDFQLPARMFYDKEDGFTRNLSIVVLDKNHKTFNSSSWIQFDASTQLLYGLPTSTVAKQQPTGGYVIHIVAMDSNFATANSTTRIVIDGTNEMINYVIKINMVVNVSRLDSDVDAVLKFLASLKSYLGNAGMVIQDYFMENDSLIVSVSNTAFLGNECNLEELQTISSHLFFQNAAEFVNETINSTSPTVSSSGMFTVQPSFISPSRTQSIESVVNSTSVLKDGQSSVTASAIWADTEPNQNFTRVMAPDFLISNVSEKKTGSCSNNPPVVFQPTPHFIITTRGLFSLALPSKTFYDFEDGFTTNLSLVLLSSSGQALPPNSWVQFNATTYELYGVITDDLSPNDNYTFLLRAADTYGLTANTSITVQVPSKLQNVGLKLNMIFKSNCSVIVPHVDIMKRLVGKIASYYNHNITVLSFERGSSVPSTDLLSWTLPKLDSTKCDLELLHGISQKARFADNQPNEGLQRALLPEFELLLVFEQRFGSCADNLNSPPTAVVSNLKLNITRIPTDFHYSIPRNIFNDTEDGDTRNLTLTLLEIDDQEIPRNSSVQFNAPLQVLYGIFTKRDLDSNSRILRFVLRAMDSGGKTASSNLEIILGNAMTSHNYELRVTFLSYLSSTLPDVMQLIDFQEKLRGFPILRHMQSASYDRSSGYPAKFFVSFINSSLNFNESFCDFSEISRITETFQDSSGKLRSELGTTFLPEFVLQDVHVERFGPCENLPNNPPTVNRVIPTINLTVCEMLKFQIAEDVFLDHEDGNTRNLSLRLENVKPEQHELDWIFLDGPSQIFYAVPSLDVVRNQPSGGYLFNLTATDSHGETVEIDFTVSVRDGVLKDSYRLSVVVRVLSLLVTPTDLVVRTVELVEATERYLSGSPTNHIRVVEYRKLSQSTLKLTWSNCSLRYTPCDYRSIEKIRQATIYTRSLPHPGFIQSLAPTFIVDSVEDEMRGPCLNKEPVVRRELEPLNATLCEGLLRYSIPNDTFYDEEDGYTRNLTLSLLSSTSLHLSGNSWLAIDQTQTLIAYPNVDAFRTQPESGYDFLVTARDINGLSTSLSMKVLYQGEVPRSNYEVTLVLQAQFGNLTNSVDQMRVILDDLAGYMGGSVQSIRIHSFLRSGVNSSTSFFTWSNCSFVSTACDQIGIQETSKRLKDPDGEIPEELKNAFHPYFELTFVFEQRLGACVEDTNVRPSVKHSLYELALGNFCGLWQFEIPADFFHDKEDGGTRNLTLSLKNSDSMELPADSWIQFDQETQTLYGLPSVSNSSNSSISTREMFILLAADSQGKFSTMTLEMIFDKKLPDVHYGVRVEMSSYVGESLSDVDHLKRFVERLALFLKAKTASIMVTKYARKTTGTSSTMSVTWTNCSVNVNTCDVSQINILQQKLHLSKDEVHPGFSQAMLPYFIPHSISLEKFGLCRIAAMKSPPRLVRPIGRIVAYSGSLLKYSISEDTFLDEEDGNVLNLSLALQFSNKLPVPSSYWLRFDNTSLLITGISFVENSWRRTFRLVARDYHGNEAVDTFEVFLEARCSENLRSYQVFTHVIHRGNEENLGEEFLRKLELYFQSWLSDTNFTLLSISKKAGGNITLIVWSHARTCGVCIKVNSTIQAISENITDGNGTALREFKTALLLQFILVNISEEKCVYIPASPAAIIKGGEDDRYLLYAVPIIVLLIFLLLSFIFFICRTFVFPYESKKEEIILPESPLSNASREIHVNERVRASEASMFSSGNDGVTTVINEGFLGNNDALPEIFLDKRVSPSKSSLPQDLGPVSLQDVEPRVPTPPLYYDAVSQLAAETGRSPGEERAPAARTRIEVHELPILKRKVAPSSEAIPVSEKSDVDGRRKPREERVVATRRPPLHSEPLPEKDIWSTFDDEEPSKPLRLPTPPEVGMLRLPPVPKPLGNSPLSDNAPNSQPSSAYSTPLLTPNYSQTSLNNTYNVRQIHSPSAIPPTSPNNHPNPPAYTEYPYGTPMRERTQLGVQSPLGFPFPGGPVPYVDHRTSQSAPRNSTSNDLHEVLGQLRETVNREMDRRNEADKYLDHYFNRK